MSLTSAMNTALTGMSAAETMIDVDGNNIANSNTVGFKASTATFATQFLQTQGLGSSPTTNNGGTNPRQIGMGTMVAAITPNFTQGTVEISSNTTDMAIQGDGFFIVQDSSGGQEYTRNGVFKLNANNELVTSMGNRLLGYGIDTNYAIQSTRLVPLTIPLGTVAVAKATEKVELQGTLTPSGTISTAAKIIDSAPLGDASYSQPATPPDDDISLPQTLGAGAGTQTGTATPLTTGTYYYRVTFSDTDPPVVSPDGTPTEGMATTSTFGVATLTDDSISIPTDQLANPCHYRFVSIYRTSVSSSGTDPGDYRLLETVATVVPTALVPNPNATAAAYVDNGSVNDGSTPLTTPLLNTQSLTGTYDYYIAYVNASGSVISRPSDVLSGVSVTNGRVHLTNLPVPPAGDGWTKYVIYRNYSVGGTNLVEVDRVNITPNATFTDSVSDATLQTRYADTTKRLNFNGPPATASTRLVDLIRNTAGTSYPHLFPTSGTLEFTGVKGGSTLATKQFNVVGSNPPDPGDTRVANLLQFFTESLGIQLRDPTNGIPASEDTVHPTDPPTMIDPGATINNGIIQLVGNNGLMNAVDISLNGLQFSTTSGKSTVDMPFTKYQDAIGESVMTDFLVYDSLGTACNVRITADLESRDDTATTYRWFADSPSNSLPSGEPTIAVGTGTITFDGNGKFISASNDKVSIYRSGTPAVSPLVFNLDFLNISGLAEQTSTLQMKSQDGSAPGKLSSFIVGEDGLITGVFSNGIKRNLGQVRLARFSNPAGLEQKGENLFASGVNSGVPIEGNPGQQGIGSLIAGAVELSNTDIGGSLTDLILASTMYRGNARVITTTQQLFDELLALKR
jgi:flagellar hook protein FlgE